MRGRSLVAAVGVAVLACCGSSVASVRDSSSQAVITAAGNQTCAVTSARGVKCWGFNGQGQLGDGTETTRLTAVAVSGLSSGVEEVATGGFDNGHTCALLSGGAVQCWGDNIFGQVGNGTTDDASRPVSVAGLSSGVESIALGDSYTCALLAGGNVECWGENELGELGDGTVDEHHSPEPVSGLGSGVQAIAAGSDHTCAITAAGGVECWGDNSNGDVGDGTTAIRLKPVPVAGLSSGVKAIVGGGDDPEFNGHTCALLTSGGVECWGNNGSGQLGDGTETNRHTPVAVTGLAGPVQALSAGGEDTCALLTSGRIECWGDNLFGQLAGGTQEEGSSTPVELPGLTSVEGIASGADHECALLAAGSVKCWGYDSDGQVGAGSVGAHPGPTRVLGFADGVGVLALQVRGKGILSAHGLSCRKAACAFERPPGTKVTLTERAVKGWKFTGWRGACKGAATHCSVVVKTTVYLTARFARRI